jgi:hypothetical protein
MSLAAMFLWFALAAHGEAAGQASWLAVIGVNVKFPEGVSAPISVRIKEPANLHLEGPGVDGKYRVTSDSPFSHVLLEVSSSPFATESVNAVLSWEGTSAFASVDVALKHGAVPSVRGMSIVKAQSGKSGLELSIFNPTDHEIVISALRLTGSTRLPARRSQRLLESYGYEVIADVTRNEIRDAHVGNHRMSIVM